MKPLSMYRYTPLLLIFALLTFTGCTPKTPKTTIEQATSITIGNEENYAQVQGALLGLEKTIEETSPGDKLDQYNKVKDKIEEIRTLFDSIKTEVNASQAEKFEEQIGKTEQAIYMLDFAQALDDTKALQDILQPINPLLVLAPTNAANRGLDDIKKEIQKLQKAQNSITVVGKEISFPLVLAKGFGLIGFIAFVIAVAALSRVKKQRNKVKEIMATRNNFQSEIKGLKDKLEKIGNDIDIELRSAISDQSNRIKELERAQNLLDTNKSGFTTPTSVREVVPFTPPLQPSRPIEPQGPSKSGLIAALNNGDRQQLREAALSELNITSESENAIITGRSANTELEVVTGGGSYLLVMLQGQPWLFPTEKTLKGFTAVQSSKGMFESEQQTIANCQLLEPALLEGSGNRWTIKKIGRIAIP